MSLEGSPSKYTKAPHVKPLSHEVDIVDNEDEEKVHKNRKSGLCWSNFQDFSSSTSLHGIQYLGDSKRTILERIWWLIMIILSFCGCTFMIYKIWVKWNYSPVIVSFAETSMPVWQIPFPAITLCSEIKVLQTVYNFTEVYHDVRNLKKFTDEEKFQMETASLICDGNLRPEGSKYGNKSTLDFIKNVAHQEENLFWYCVWKKVEINCSELFKPILTEEGQCYTFNMLSAQELFRKKMIYNGMSTFEHGNKSTGWDIDTGYPRNVSINAYPERGVISGVEGGLTIILATNTDDTDYICSQTSQGFKISMHSPVDFPRVSRKYIVLPVNNDMIVAIKPDMLTTSDGLAAYDPHRRQCYQDNERKLKFFRVYTQQNCQLECLSNYTSNSCGCVAFWMPRDRNIAICSSGKITCMEGAQEDLEKYEINYAIAVENGDKEKIKRMKSINCDCLPGCTSLNYDLETSQADFKWQEISEARKILEFVNTTFQFSRISMFFKDGDFINSRRSELYGITDFLANCGGILGLFLGFSFLSLAEVLYFLSIGPMCNLKRRIVVARGNFQKSWKQRRH